MPGNVVTGRLIVGKEEGALTELVERIRSFLPPEVELHGVAKVSKRYNARWEGARRDYRFLVPSFCVVPTLAKVRQWLAAKRPFDPPTAFSAEDLKQIEEELGLRKVRLSAEQLHRFREAFYSFEGTHYFGNFANKKLDPMGPQGFRHLRRVYSGEPFVDDFGREWLPLEISGDSFLTHQIRKMVATAALVAQGALSMEFIQAAMHRRIYVKTHRFPPTGLMFQRPFFSARTPQRAGVEVALQSEEVCQRVEAMQARLEVAILKEAEEELSAVKWLACVAHFEPENMESEVLEEFRALKRTMDRQIRARRAASTQVVCIRASDGEDLWLGRHFQKR
ncbi:PUS1 [Symbiodinium pilosum]|uniref:tRNA pseudouridine synthase n=1 Tax=Symbiodinium pilosum TaxID=2952 RepID=A0A812K6J7_SYMPI|nr:PUS1 [Symbiodinium pilosum]